MILSTRRTRAFSCGVSVGQPLAFRAFPRRVPHHEPRHRPDGAADRLGCSATGRTRTARCEVWRSRSAGRLPGAAFLPRKERYRTSQALGRDSPPGASATCGGDSAQGRLHREWLRRHHLLFLCWHLLPCRPAQRGRRATTSAPPTSRSRSEAGSGTAWARTIHVASNGVSLML